MLKKFGKNVSSDVTLASFLHNQGTRLNTEF